MNKRIAALLLSTAMVTLCLAGCGGITKSNDDYNASHHVTFKAAYAVTDSNSEIAELWAFSTVNADEKENLYGVHYQNASKGGQIGTTAPYIEFDESNLYTDKYFLNKSKYDSYFGGTPYGCWSDMQQLYAGTNDKAYLVMVFNVGKNDLENCEEAAVDNVSYDFKFNVSDIQTAGSVEEVASRAAELQ